MAKEPPVPVIEVDDEKPIPGSKSPGVVIGGGGCGLVLTLLVTRLSSDTFTWAAQWNQVSGLAVAAVLLGAWAWVEARSSRTHMGIEFFDRPREVKTLGLTENTEKPKE